MATLYTIGNLNMRTVELVARTIRETEPDLLITKVVIFDSVASERLQNEQMAIYRKYFGNVIRVGILINEDGTIDENKLAMVFADKDEKIVDLSNGQKSTSSMLYMAANLCRIDRVYYLLLKTAPKDVMVYGQDYEYIKMRPINCMGNLSKISYFDLIYYSEEIEQLFTEDERTSSGPFRAMYDGITTGIGEFFASSDFRSVVNNTTIGNEIIINALFKYIQTDKHCQQFCAQAKVVIEPKKDPIEGLKNFVKKYKTDGEKQELVDITTVPYLLATLREYRNISAHYSKQRISLTEEQARTVITLSIEVLKRLHMNREVWDFIGQNH
ncbi:MAG: hypothetical protein LUE86_07575 [Clostridiales bacterium]|nr:hypothetical protein [Clostridiales bacterium]